MSALRRAATVTAVVALSMSVAPAFARADSPRTTVVLALAPSSPATLARLAAAPPHDLRARRAAVADLAPSRTTRDRVITWLRDRGFTVGSSTPWTLTAAGPSAVADALFPDASPPPALAGDVESVTGPGDPHHWRRRSLPGGYQPAQFHDAYAVPGSPLGAGTTVATLQLSGWSALADHSGHSDLDVFANAAGISPVPTLDAVSVNGASVSKPDAPGDDFEVALDQEALMVGAPAAHQRVYVTTNDDNGFILGLQRLVDDVRAGVPITAASMSWGDCEQDIPAPVVAAVNTRLQMATALGVTVFTATGDTSVWDCPPGTPWAGQETVDFPGSSPYVVAVGGTTLAQSATGWAESAWGSPTVDYVKGDGGGGGVSAVFERPAWQRGIPSQPVQHRLTPDIASDADPHTGLAVYWTSPNGGTWWGAGGTSLGAPMQAGMFVSALTSVGRTAGVGDIHTALYAHPEDFRDITSGTNHAHAAGPGYDIVTGLGTPQWSRLAPALVGLDVVAAPATNSPTVPLLSVWLPNGTSATGWAAGEGATVDCSSPTSGSQPAAVPIAAGPDRTTSVTVIAHTTDGQCLRATAPVAVDTQAPTASASLRPFNGTDNRLLMSWSGSDPAPSSGGLVWHAQLVRLDDGVVVWATDSVSNGAIVPVYGNRMYRLSVRVTDLAGNTSRWVTSGVVKVPYDDTVLSRSGGWDRRTSTDAYMHAYLASATRGAWVQRTITGSEFDLVATRSPLAGSVDVLLDGRPWGRIDLRSGTRAWRQWVQMARWPVKGTHTVTLRVVGDGYVYVDGVYYR